MRLTPLKDVLTVASNEFRQFRRNRTAMLISLVVLPLFFTSSLGGASGSATSRFSPTAKVAIAFIDEDLTGASSMFREILARSGDFDNLIDGFRVDSALASLGTGRIYAAIVVPNGFQESLLRNQTVKLILYMDDSEPFISQRLTSALTNSLVSLNIYSGVQTVQSRQSERIQIIRRGVVFGGFSIGFTIVLSLVVVFATFYEVAGGMSREYEEGTYARLAVTPVSLGALILGKTLHVLALNAIRTFIVLGLAVYIYGAQPKADVGTLLAISLLISLLSIGFGFIISSLGLSVRAVIIIEFFLILFLFAFSGFIVDREMLQGISRVISTLLPWAYGIEMFKRTILVGQSLLNMPYHLLSIVVSTAIFYIVSYALLKISRERLVT
ncbi:MAG: ABC transporter permease [Candidatus Bathyarchaeia archaeon]